MSTPAVKLPIADDGIPPQPALSNAFMPTMADLLAWARHMERIARECDVTADPGQPMNPYSCIGALRTLTEANVTWLERHAQEEEKSLLLMQRLQHEDRQDRAHELLMATDSDYADEFEDFEDDVP